MHTADVECHPIICIGRQIWPPLKCVCLCPGCCVPCSPLSTRIADWFSTHTSEVWVGIKEAICGVYRQELRADGSSLSGGRPQHYLNPRKT